jgi:hypothetical protein
MKKSLLRLLLRHADGSVKILDDITEPGDFDEQYLFEFAHGIVELFDCYYGGEFPTLKGIAVEYAENEGYGEFLNWTVGDDLQDVE